MADLEATAGQQVTLTAAHAGPSTDVTWSWSKPAGSTAPSSTSNVLQWTLAGTDFGTYTATATSATAGDSPQQGTINVTRPPFVPSPDNPIPTWRTAAEAAQGAPISDALYDLCLRFWETLNDNGFIPTIENAYLLCAVDSIAAAAVPLWGAPLKLTNITAGDYSKVRGIRTASLKYVSSINSCDNLACMYSCMDYDSFPSSGCQQYGSFSNLFTMGFWRFAQSSGQLPFEFELSKRVEGAFRFIFDNAAWTALNGEFVSGIHCSPDALDCYRFAGNIVASEPKTVNVASITFCDELGIGCYADARGGSIAYRQNDSVNTRAFFSGKTTQTSARSAILAQHIKDFSAALRNLSPGK